MAVICTRESQVASNWPLFCKKNTGFDLLFYFTPYSLMTRLNSKMWCVMLGCIGPFILQQFLYISCLRTVIANGPTQCLKGELAAPDMEIHLQSYHLSWCILIKSDLAAPNRVALVHSIGVHHNTKRCNRWLNKYIFSAATYPRLNNRRVPRDAKGCRSSTWKSCAVIMPKR